MFLRLPQDASDKITTRSMASVEGAFCGAPIQTCLQPDGMGGHWLRVKPDLVHEAGVRDGEVVELEISQMATEPEPEVPEDLWDALSNSPLAMATWQNTTAIARRDWILWLTSGKKAETRLIRLEKGIDMLSKGKRRICCFDRSGMYSKTLTCPTPASESK